MTDTFTASNGTKNKFLIDGFPRNYDNLEGWSKEMDGKTNLQFVLFFKCSETVSLRSDANGYRPQGNIQHYVICAPSTHSVAVFVMTRKLN